MVTYGRRSNLVSCGAGTGPCGISHSVFTRGEDIRRWVITSLPDHAQIYYTNYTMLSPFRDVDITRFPGKATSGA